MIARKGVNQGSNYMGQEVVAQAKSRATGIEFDCTPLGLQPDSTVPTGVTTETNVYQCSNASVESTNIGTQTIFNPLQLAAGWNVSGDQTDNEGKEIAFGVVSGCKTSFTAQTDQFYAELKFSIAVVAGTDLCFFGFRKAEPFDATFANYLDYAGLNVVSGDIKTFTDQNNSGTATATDTTQDWADAATHTLGVYVDADGWVTYSVDGVEITDNSLAPKLQLDSGDVMVPFLHFLHANASQAGAITLQHFECAVW